METEGKDRDRQRKKTEKKTGGRSRPRGGVDEFWR